MYIKVVYIHLCASDLKNHYLHGTCVCWVCPCLKIIFLDKNNNDQSITKIQKHHYIKVTCYLYNSNLCFIPKEFISTDQCDLIFLVRNFASLIRR